MSALLCLWHEAVYAHVYIHCICLLEWIVCFSVAVILLILCVCGVYVALCQLSMKFSVRAFPVALIALWFWVWEGWMKHQEGWVLKVKSKMIKKDWLLSLSCEIANCFPIF